MQEDKRMTLRDLKPGQTGRVTAVGAAGANKRRIKDMGVKPGLEIRVIKKTTHGDTK